MGIFDSMKGKAADLADDAGRAGKVAAAQVKLKSLQGDVDGALTELGRKAFGLVEEGELDHASLEAAVAKVREARQLVADKKAEIDGLRAED